jgi:DNA-binding Lrp family transcriptional regulator
MDNFRTVYKILQYIESMMDQEAFDESGLTGARLGVSEARCMRLLELLSAEGYIEGVSVRREEDAPARVDAAHAGITFKGLKYLQEDAFMRRAANALKRAAMADNAVKS